MALRLSVTSENRKLLGDDHTREFSACGGTIGRNTGNDWTLPDPVRYVSGRHATIDFQAGAFYLADVSSNGVYINHADEPLGKGNPRRLFDGDHLRMGDFEMVVHLDEGEDLEMPPEPPPTVVPDHIEQLVTEDVIRSSLEAKIVAPAEETLVKALSGMNITRKDVYDNPAEPNDTLADMLIVSDVDLSEKADTISVTSLKEESGYRKCERSWKYFKPKGDEDITPRDAAAVAML